MRITLGMKGKTFKNVKGKGLKNVIFHLVWDEGGIKYQKAIFPFCFLGTFLNPWVLSTKLALKKLNLGSGGLLDVA